MLRDVPCVWGLRTCCWVVRVGLRGVGGVLGGLVLGECECVASLLDGSNISRKCVARGVWRME